MALSIAAISLTSGDGDADVREALVDGVRGGELILNLRAEGDHDTLRATVRAALEAQVDANAGLAILLEHEEYFRPAPPEPTHRDEVTAP